MGLIIDIPGNEAATYGFNGKNLENRIPDGSRRREQRTALSDRLWLDPQTGEAGYQFMPVAIGGIQLWNPIIRLAARKLVVDTPMVEMDGSVKEIISIDDYIINIRGTIKNTDGLWPDDDVAALKDLWIRKEAVPITCALTGHFLNGSEYVLITHLNIPDNPGYVESVRYELECSSDKPFVLELEE